MDKNAIKKFAVWARNELIDRVSQKAQYYGITKEGIEGENADSVHGVLLSPVEKKQRRALISEIKKNGYQQVMEAVAYTWFNRFSALRFMEVNGYLPNRVRVFTDANNAFNPQILTEALHLDLDGLDQERVIALKQANQTEELYKYLLITQCNALSDVLPGMFQKIEDYTELLLPDHLLRKGSVIEQMVACIHEEDWTEQVQIIGWLYQYYNTEPKDAVFANLKKNIKVDKNSIPAATQLFTPHWIVQYMVENSLGRLWLGGHPNAELKATWKYYLDEAAQEPQVEEHLKSIRREYALLTPQDIKVIDPCCGSGHILVYMFDVLMQIYESYGYTIREAVSSIVQNNLYGLDIDERAAQLAYFAVMMIAQKYDRRFLARHIQPHVYSTAGFPDGKEYGALLVAEDPGDMPGENGQVSFYDTEWFVRHLLSQKYHVVATNPPYMSSSNMNNALFEYLKEYYPDSKSDLFACFITRGNQLVKPGGFNSMVTMQSWMFLSSFEKMRVELLSTKNITNLMHMENMVMGISFGTAVTVFQNFHTRGYRGTYNHIKLCDLEDGIPKEFPIPGNRFAQVSTDCFSKIPGAPVAYWVSEAFSLLFSNTNTIEANHISGGRNKTHNDEKYLRMIWEVPREDKWVRYAKGGAYRKWYGNIEYLIDWSTPAKEEYARHGGLIKKEFEGKVGITWTIVTAYKPSFRVKDRETIYSSVSPTIFKTDFSSDEVTLGLLNSVVSEIMLDFINPTLATNVSNIMGLPVLQIDATAEERIKSIVKECISISHTDWDSFETSWDFQEHPFKTSARWAARNGEYITVQQAFDEWRNISEGRFQSLKKNEEELNRIFIDIYGLQDELTPEIEDKDVTVRRADLGRDIRSLISYAVGCMFGRYSLDEPGLGYAGGEFNYWRYHSFTPVKANIIPICDDDYFETDILSQFIKWLKALFGEENLEENLKFIADALGGKGTPRQVIRNYFLNDFYADHLKIYQKRPIYWLFDSGKKNGFKALIYMHRYQPYTLAQLRTDYVHEQQARYRTAIESIQTRLNGASTGERVRLSKQLAKLQAQADEIYTYEQKVHHLADQMISIDLDDGVKHNYAIFQDVLAKIK